MKRSSEQKGLPLAEYLRPQNIEDVVGQEHLLAEGKPLRVAFEASKPFSMIFWGPPGVGKTTLARMTAKFFDCEWIALSAVFSGVKDIRLAVEQAKTHQDNHRHTILFIDEIHRFNKAQQDALLPYTESGLISFIGATTENPSFEVNRSLLSRSQVFVLKPLDQKALKQLGKKVFTKVYQQLSISEKALDLIIMNADGDARRFLNLLEQLESAALQSEMVQIDEAFIQKVLTKGLRQFDKGGDNFYDQISALHKSVRGSDPDASLYWLCRMLDGGADPMYLCRRIIRMAWEDIGLADPRALQIANDAANTYERLGSPEGELALSEAVIYLAVAAKSNAAYKAYKKAMQFVKQDASRPVPLHLRNAPTKLSKDMNHGTNYRYAHDEPHGYAAGENYFPQGMPKPTWYVPVMRGLEKKIGEKMDFLRHLDEKNK